MPENVSDLKFGFDCYQALARRTAFPYIDAIDKIDYGVHAPNLRRILKLTYAALGLGEQGEVQGKVKKIIRDDFGEIFEDRRDAIRKEIGDTIWYLARVADELGISLGDIAVENVRRLEDRRERGVLCGDGDLR